MQKRILRNRNDFLTLFAMLAISVLLLLILTHSFDLAGSLFLLPFLVFALLIVNIINHNFIHTPLSDFSVLNSLIGAWVSLLQGHSSNRILIPHNMNHHVHFRDEKDWMHFRLSGEGLGLFRGPRYIWRSLLLPNFEKRQPAIKKIPEKVRSRMKLESLLLLVQIASLSIFFTKSYLLLILPAQFFAICLLMFLNLIQHDHCDLESQYLHSRNFTSPILNFILFNNGYHAAHHLYPSAHWSELRKIHEKEIMGSRGAAEPNFDNRSFWTYLFKSFLFKRASS